MYQINQTPTVRQISVSQLVSADWNYKSDGTADDIAKLAESITRDQSAGVLAVRQIRDGVFEVIDGNHRLKAIQRLGWADAWCEDFGSITKAEAVLIARRRNYQWFEDDADKLESLFKGEVGPQFVIDDLSLFMPDDVVDLRGLLGIDEVTESDDAIVEPEAGPTVSRRGDLWLLGKHRLLCGDATSADDVACLLDGAVPFIMVTDPPYGVEYDADWRDSARRQELGSAATAANVANDSRCDWSDAYRLFPGAVAYVWHSALHAVEFHKSLSSVGFVVRSNIIWRKQALVLSRGHYHWIHEPAWYAVREGATAKWCGDRTQTTVWDISGMCPYGRVEERFAHATQKPIECMARPIRNHGGIDDDVYDPFVGSGTTIVAAERLGRRCYAMEIDPVNVDLVLKRWGGLSESQPAPILASTGQPWSDVKGERLAEVPSQ